MALRFKPLRLTKSHNFKKNREHVAHVHERRKNKHGRKHGEAGKRVLALTVSGGFDANRKRVKYTRTIRASSKREAEKELAKFVTEIEAGTYVQPSKMTLAAFVDEWMKHYAEKQLAPKTLINYKEDCVSFPH